MTETAVSPTAKPARPPATPDRWRALVRALIKGDRPYMIYVAFAVLLVVFSLSSPWFLSLDNFLNIGRQTALVSIIAIGMTFVIIGSADRPLGRLDAGSVRHVRRRWPWCTYGNHVAGRRRRGPRHGGARRARQRLLTTRLAIPSFLVTLGTLSAARGSGADAAPNTKPVIITERELFRDLRRRLAWLGVPVPIAWTLLAAAVGILLLHYSVYGRQIYAAGGNATAALYSGIDIKRVTTLAFVLTGDACGAWRPSCCRPAPTRRGRTWCRAWSSTSSRP